MQVEDVIEVGGEVELLLLTQPSEILLGHAGWEEGVV